MELNRILKIIQANCTVMPSQPSGVVYVFNEDELSSTAELIFNEMQPKEDTPPQLHKHDVMRPLPGWEVRNDMMHEIVSDGKKVGNVEIIDLDKIKLLWTYDKWLQIEIGLPGNGA